MAGSDIRLGGYTLVRIEQWSVLCILCTLCGALHLLCLLFTLLLLWVYFGDSNRGAQKLISSMAMSLVSHVMITRQFELSPEIIHHHTFWPSSFATHKLFEIVMFLSPSISDIYSFFFFFNIKNYL